MKILVLGGTRFFGREFALLRAKKGDRVTVFSSLCPSADLPDTISQIHGDRRSLPDLQDLARTRWDVVVDNICFTPEEAEIAGKAFAGRAGLWIFSSTGDVHLTLQGAASPFDESMADRLPEDPRIRAGNLEPYGQGKRDAEKVFLRLHEAGAFPVSIARFPAAIGPRDPKLRAHSYWLRLADGGPVILPDGGLYYRRYIWSGDAARALETLATHKQKAEGEIYHFGETAPITLREWLELSAFLMQLKPELVSIPMDWLAKNGFSPDWSPYYHPGNYVLGIMKAETLLDWKSADRKKWMAETIAWYFSEYSGHKPENYAHRAAELELVKRWKTGNGH
ncbi:MAG: NAD-dependent epimerase/dehydratase family protein [Elusimicrobiales bacterium]|nr:NAD-dependent epimerase/dehydratase family protein [Elusimicrobiales bacterium]